MEKIEVKIEKGADGFYTARQKDGAKLAKSRNGAKLRALYRASLRYKVVSKWS